MKIEGNSSEEEIGEELVANPGGSLRKLNCMRCLMIIMVLNMCIRDTW